MSIKFRNYCGTIGFTDDYYKVREFLIKHNNPNYPFGRWDWMITHGHLDRTGLSKIGLWEDENQLVAIATYDCSLGKSYIFVLPEYVALRKEMLLYASSALKNNEGKFSILVPDIDKGFQDIAALEGYVPTQDKETDAVFPISINNTNYTLPEGFRITSLAEDYDLYKYGQVLWKGFNHEANGEGKFNPSDEDMQDYEASMKRPNVNLDIKIAVVAPNGDFVSHCGMWQDKDADFALVEPVATDPDYRKLGLGKATVLEGIKRCGLLGAKKAFVGSSQQFYYSIGFRPYSTATFWTRS